MAGTREATAPILPEETSWRISYAEIGTLAQVQRPVVTTWARRHADFPEPVAYEGASPIFDGGEVAEWLLSTGRGNADADQIRAELVLHTLSAWRREIPARALVDTVTALLCLRQLLDEPLSELPWRTILERASETDFEDTYLHKELRDLPDAERQGPLLAVLADHLTEAAYTPADALERVMDARRRLGCDDLAADEPIPLVSRAMAHLSGIARLNEREQGATVAVLYPRSGDLLVALREAVSDAEDMPFFLSADPKPDLARLTRRRLMAQGVQEYEMDLVDGEELATDDWGDPHVVVCALPYEAAETRSPLAVLQTLQDLTDLLAEDRTAIVLGPADALVRPLPARGEADRLRRDFLEQHLLKAAISLPEGVLPFRPAHRTAIWILHRTPEDKRTGQVLLADLSSRNLTPQTLDALVEDVDIFRDAGWRADSRHEPRNAAVVRATALTGAPGAAFTPQHRPHADRYTRTVVERPARISETELRLQQLIDATRSALDHAPTIRANAVLRPDDQPARRTTVARLLKDRRLRRLPGHRIAAEHLLTGGAGHYTVLTSAEITGSAPVDSHRIDRAVLLNTYEHAYFTEPGDIVVTATPSFGAYVDDEGLSVVAFPARVLRARSDAEHPVRPRVLAALLRSAATEHRRVSGAVRSARRIEDLLIPDLPSDEAERYDALLADIARRTALLRQHAAALDDLTALTAAGLIDGTLTLTEPPLVRPSSDS
ncbi:hypothetical protein PV702_16085 [Streptomyces sp. FL06-04B]|uniref:hypothetical protein n=1 Tax=unclassified Streptomyces TaxID=2593676 RepID=UPI0029BE39D8|nr:MULTISPECIES: hypothetical protein [unclassified Streptomyces]MDX3607930.1 hypothetical protein [Streptomyces sp. FL06-04B]MDX3739439.1 hypothetical protein [Streptomyces sp. ID01-15D]